MRMKRLCIGFLVGVFLVGCGGGSDSDTLPQTGISADGMNSSDMDSNDMDAAGTSFDGSYNILAVSTTDVDITGGTCGDATGVMTITNSALGGSVMSTTGIVFDISGNVNAQGVITGGFAQSGNNAANFEGASVDGRITGTWADIFECMGTWEATAVT